MVILFFLHLKGNRNRTSYSAPNLKGGNKLRFIKRVAIFLIIAVVILSGTYLFSHSNPERAIRTYLFLDGYLTKAFITEVSISDEVPWKGKYYCKNPGIGPDFIAAEKKDLGLWYVDLEHSGGA